MKCVVCGNPHSEEKTCVFCKTIIRERFQEICPPIMRNTDVSRLPLNLAQEAMSYEYGPMGVLFHGKSGVGKSRSAWVIVRRMMEDGRRVGVYTGVEFSHEVDERFSTGSGPEWIESVNNKDMLVIDDVDKARMTERVQTELFGVVDHFTSAGKPLIITMNSPSQVMTEMMGEKYGRPFIRRISQFCKVVKP